MNWTKKKKNKYFINKKINVKDIKYFYQNMNMFPSQ